MPPGPGWLRYGGDPAPAAGTVLLALALAVHHQAAGLAVALPPTARVDPAILVRFARHGAVVLAAAAAVGALALLLAHPAGSSSLEVLGRRRGGGRGRSCRCC